LPAEFTSRIFRAVHKDLSTPAIDDLSLLRLCGENRYRPGAGVVRREIAREAYRDFGRGSGHPARLNFGDCFAYALARATGEPLLFKGDGFSQTDIEPALT
jgi:hypothetical protein